MTAALQHTAAYVWTSHRAAVRAWLVQAHPSTVGITPRSGRSHLDGPSGHRPQLGDIARVGQLMTHLGVRLESALGRQLVGWAMGRGRGWGGSDAKLKALALRIKRHMRKLGIVSTGAEEYAIRSYRTAENDGRTHKYAVRVDCELTS